jgi:tripeptide aminopeptidase
MHTATLESLLSHLDEDRLLELQLRIAQTPAPTFAETPRAELIAALWSDAGLHPETDAVGNIIAARPGRREGPMLVISAHLDTVFGPGQDLRVRMPGEHCDFCDATVPEGEYHGAGIGDCAAGLAAVTAVAEALAASGAETESPLLFVATVGEEAAGDLRGARALFAGPWAPGIGAFVTVDVGVTGAIVRETTSTRRLRVTFRGPGGHSWDDYGAYSPVHAVGEAIARITAYDPPRQPRTSLNVGVIEGGRSVNAIPEEASFLLDMRSVEVEELERLAAHALEAIEQAHRHVAGRTRGEGSYSVEVFSERPGGRIPEEAPLVQAAVEALKAEGFEPRFGPGSLDANIPMSMGIPAIGFPWGGSSRSNHSIRESYRSRRRVEGVRALARLAATYR